MTFNTDNISRFPYSGEQRRSESTEYCGLTAAEIDALRVEYLRKWEEFYPISRRAMADATAEIIADMQAARALDAVRAAMAEA